MLLAPVVANAHPGSVEVVLAAVTPVVLLAAFADPGRPWPAFAFLLAAVVYPIAAGDLPLWAAVVTAPAAIATIETAAAAEDLQVTRAVSRSVVLSRLRRVAASLAAAAGGAALAVAGSLTATVGGVGAAAVGAAAAAALIVIVRRLATAPTDDRRRTDR